MKLTDDELNLALAEKLEPKKRWNIISDTYSPLRFWYCRWAVNYQNAWEPRNFCGDPEMRWFLLNWLMTNPDFEEVIIGDDLEVECTPTREAFDREKRVVGFAFKASSLERLPAEAAALALGIGLER